MTFTTLKKKVCSSNVVDDVIKLCNITGREHTVPPDSLLCLLKEKYSHLFGSDVIFAYIQLSKVDINSRPSYYALKSADVN